MLPTNESRCEAPPLHEPLRSGHEPRTLPRTLPRTAAAAAAAAAAGSAALMRRACVSCLRDWPRLTGALRWRGALTAASAAAATSDEPAATPDLGLTGAPAAAPVAGMPSGRVHVRTPVSLLTKTVRPELGSTASTQSMTGASGRVHDVCFDAAWK